jgi:hypothetical protein
MMDAKMREWNGNVSGMMSKERCLYTQQERVFEKTKIKKGKEKKNTRPSTMECARYAVIDQVHPPERLL